MKTISILYIIIISAVATVASPIEVSPVLNSINLFERQVCIA